MQAYWTLVRRELGGHFFSWTGYVVIAAVLLLLVLSFVDLLQKFNGEAVDQPLTSLFYSTLYFWLILLLAAPVITMRSFAAEKASGTEMDLAVLLDALPEKYRQVITLFYLEEKSYEEVAARLGIPLGTVKTFLYRAKKELLKIGARTDHAAA